MRYRIIRNGYYIRTGHITATVGGAHLLNVYIRGGLRIGDIVYLDSMEEFWEYYENDADELDSRMIEDEDLVAKLYDLILDAESCPA